MLCLKSLSQRVSVVAVRKTTSVKNNRYQTSTGMDAIYSCYVLRGPSVGLFPILVRYIMHFSAAFVPLLQLRYFYWIVSVQSVGEVNSKVPYVWHCLSQGNAAALVEILKHLDDADQDNVRQYYLDCYRHRGLRACHSISCVHSTTICSQLGPTVHCVSWVNLTNALSSCQITLIRSVVPHLMSTLTTRITYLRSYVV